MEFPSIAFPNLFHLPKSHFSKTFVHAFSSKIIIKFTCFRNCLLLPQSMKKWEM